jgi:hypothetical protein
MRWSSKPSKTSGSCLPSDVAFADELASIKLIFNLLKQCVGAGLDVYIRHLSVLELRFRSYSEEPFSDAKKVPQNACPSIRILA